MTKLIIAFIRPEKLEDVKDELEKVGIYPMTIVEVKGRGTQKGVTLNYRGVPVTVEFIPKLQIELIVEDEEVDKAVEAIAKGAYTGHPGDGRIVILPVEKNIKIRDYYEKVLGGRGS
ncbi:P-II family nitrogen regulator [Ignicoccus hospitalis]|uniref:Nitrogen regulatory protein P-II n=1 Tax=Ignicoccus hospitalis (strain KIN4/I / DSM 18386 / JCM 14125) TaxID=453591 RepID=A8AC18_IGNH4|nr:P-II family nitrogen regulator [Ignicoccus hospitalis]ABU82470.1 nitrogen regulatory protein P-II [Ignicoccus hospitalis KIN4/I]HIH90564.1 P-II family nitrogen regulator [Desulfurococcaceae archaeon]